MADPAALSPARILARFLMAFAVMGGLLFWPAGTLGWLQGWLLIAMLMGWGLIMLVWLRKRDPALAAKRMSNRLPSRGWDRAIVLLSAVAWAVLLPLAALDAVRMHWSRVPAAVQAAGFAGIAVSLAAIAWVMRSNPFLSRNVEIQDGQRVVSAGPYRWVRHPMYSAYLLLVLSFPPALGSWYSLPAGLAIALLLVVRIRLEERTLLAELSGYRDYTHATRWRLLPGLW